MTKPYRILAALMSLCAAGNTLGAKDHISPIAIVAAKDGKTVYVAGHTSRQVVIMDVAKAKPRLVTVPASPTGLALSKNGDNLFVTVAGPAGGVHVLDAKKGKVSHSLPTGHTPISPVLSPDGKTLYVCNRFNNDVSVIKLKGEEQPVRIPVLREPIAAAITPDGKYLFVANHLPVGSAHSAYVAAVVSVIDTSSGKVSASIQLPNGSTSLRGLCISPDGKYVYVTHILGRYHMPTTQLDRGWINTNAMTVIDTETLKALNTVLLDDTDLGSANPWGVTCTADGKYICVAISGAHELSVIDQAEMLKRLKEATDPEDVCNDLAFLVGARRRLDLAGNGPRGLGMVGTTAYVAEYFSNSIGVMNVDPDASPTPKASSLSLGPETKESVARKGERLFHDAKLCFQQWQSCTSCHPDGRSDSLNWDLLNDGMFNPKQSKNMLLAHKTPPAMSTGIRPKAETAVRSGIAFILFAVRQDEGDAVAMDEYLKSLEPVPSPYLVDGKLSPAAQRGGKLFYDKKVGCIKCHRGKLYTDLSMYNVASKGKYDRTDTFDTPTLIECWRTAPYMHDGKYGTMKELLTEGKHGDTHGELDKLDDKQIDDLVEFVLSL
ncbi:MAG: cell surface protein [Kiritimatiellia bacterium]|nr:cell surface protein [Kiritimatiellia bacterium]